MAQCHGPIPLETVEAARSAVRGYKTGAPVRERFYELSGAVARCGVCGRAMVARPVTYKLKSGGKSTIHYYRCTKAYGYSGRCEHTTVYRAGTSKAARGSSSCRCSGTPSACAPPWTGR